MVFHAPKPLLVPYRDREDIDDATAVYGLHPWNDHRDQDLVVDQVLSNIRRQQMYYCKT